MNKDNFLKKWSLIFEKGFLRYAFQYISPLIILSIISITWIYFKTEATNIFSLIKYNILFILFYSSLIIHNWFSSKKNIKKLLKIIKI